MGPPRTPLRPRLLAAATTLAFAGFLPASAAGQSLSVPGLSGGGFEGMDNNGELPSRKVIGRGSVALFDLEHISSATEAEGAPMWWRKAGSDSTQHGWELSLGAVTETRVGQVFLAGIIRTQFRYFDSASFALSPIQNMAMAGVRLGPIEPEVRVGMSLLTFDVFHGAYSFEMFSPRVEGGLGLRFGRFRLSAHGFSEYLWRWWGSSYFEKGVAFEVRLEAPKKSPIAVQ
jgi:hypothetical protein